MSRIKEEINILPSTIETIDYAIYDHINDNFNLHTTTNDGWKKVPVIWVTPERTFQIKENKELRDLEGALILPIILIERTAMTKDPSKKGAFQAHIPPVLMQKGLNASGGSIEVARRIQHKKTSEFANADAERKSNNIVKPKFVRKKTDKIVYETISISQPVHIYTTYSIILKTQYQQQMNDILQPFMTKTGNVNYFSITRDGHFYESFVDTSFSFNNNISTLSEEERRYETKIDINITGYLIGNGVNGNVPKISIRENAVEFRIPREKVVHGDIPDYIDQDTKNKGIDGGYRE